MFQRVGNTLSQRPGLRQWWLVILFLLLWETASWIGLWNELLPSPLEAVKAGAQLILTGALLSDVLVSVLRVLVGFAVAAIVGVGLGGVLGLFPNHIGAVRGLIDLFRPIPPIAWIPLTILWFGIGNSSAVFIVFLGAFFPIFVNTLDGVLNVRMSYVNTALCLGASRFLLLTDVLLPAALPQILTGLRLGLGFAWTCVIAAELVGAQSGLGYMIQLNRLLLQMENVVAGMIAIGIIGLVMNKIFYLLENYFLRWRRETVVGAPSTRW
jgi:NitT/TauT family transport system permease protein/sulfonate transport system permease protein